MADVDDLVGRLGSTDAVARALIEVGEPALAALDACVADVERPMHVRKAASLVAHQIRGGMLRAPAAAPAAAVSDAAVEARTWLEQGRHFGGDGFQRHDARTFVDGLYAAGATFVAITDRGSVMVAQLPAEAVARQRLFAIYNAEVDELGEEFGGEDTLGHEMTPEEANAAGAPDAVGEWVVDDFHVHDTGQATLRFWWD